MIQPDVYEEMWAVADRLARKEQEEQDKPASYRMERRDLHLKQMLEESE